MKPLRPSAFGVRPGCDCDVVVIGGGVAGTTAATRLADLGLRVTILDRRPLLGGRASSFVDGVTGQVADVCQHITLGCCTEFEALLERLGRREDLTYLDDILMQDASGRRVALRRSSLPVPFHLAPSLMRIPWLTWADRLAAVRLMRSIRSQAVSADALGGGDFETWARRNGVTDGLLRGILGPIIVSACNASLDQVSAQYGLAVLDRALLRTRDGYRLGVFRKPLGEVFTRPAEAALHRSGGSLRLRTTVDGVERQPAGGYRVAVRSGPPLTARAVIVATPWEALPRLVPEEALTAQIMRASRCLRPATIVATHHWFEGLLDCPEALCLIGRTVHWVFSKGITYATGGDRGTYVTTVTSAAERLARTGAAEVLDRAREDICAATQVRTLPPVRHERVFVERKATFVPVPGVDVLRPSSGTPWPGLAIAGEWTDTGWPSTMESAARSGLAAAAHVLRTLG